MSNVYRCPRCNATAIEFMWNQTTEAFLSKRNQMMQFRTLADAEADNADCWYVCPYCNQKSYRSAMVKRVKYKVKKEHFSDSEDDLFAL